jgi:tetratricopeptide (TPR) repeat protein
VKGGTELQLNKFEPGFRSYEQAYSMLQRAVEKRLILADDDRLAIASGLMGNGCMAMNNFDEAENWYLKAFQMWEPMDEKIFRDKQLFVSPSVSKIPNC